MQNDFCHRDGWLASIGADISAAREPIGPLTRLLPSLRGADVPIIWVNCGYRSDLLNVSAGLAHVYDPAGAGRGLGDQLPPRNGRTLVSGSWGAAIVDELVPEDKDVRVDKHRMSGFWDTPLESILRNLGRTTLLFGGVNADQCVMTTLQDANFLGFDCILVRDCTATTSPAFCMQATLYNVSQCFGFVLPSSDELVRALDDSAQTQPQASSLLRADREGAGSASQQANKAAAPGKRSRSPAC